MADVNRLVYLVLVIGMAASTALFALGLALSLSLPAEPNYTVNVMRELSELPQGIAQAKPSCILSLGLLILVLTPVTRILVCAYAFLANRDVKFALLSFAVLSIIGASAVLGLLFGVKPAA
ncbi:MAG: DUF1634 domain-containing protein [Candidatus Bathyarchaeia archaeon]